MVPILHPCRHRASVRDLWVKAEGAQEDALKTQPGPGVCGDTGCAGVCRTVGECGISGKDPPASKVCALPLQSRQALAPEDSFPPQTSA